MSSLPDGPQPPFDTLLELSANSRQSLVDCVSRALNVRGNLSERLAAFITQGQQRPRLFGQLLETQFEGFATHGDRTFGAIVGGKQGRHRVAWQRSRPAV